MVPIVSSARLQHVLDVTLECFSTKVSAFNPAHQDFMPQQTSPVVKVRKTSFPLQPKKTLYAHGCSFTLLLACPISCTSCTDTNSCSACSSGYFLSGGNCVVTCPSGTFSNVLAGICSGLLCICIQKCLKSVEKVGE